MAREKITERELSDCMFRPKDVNVNAEVSSEATQLVYTIIGKQDRLENSFPVLDDDENAKAEDKDIAYAKTGKNGTRFFIKTNGSQLIDPLGIYNEKDLYKKIGDVTIWRWKEVNHKVFKMYIQYLKTKNQVHYRQASREIF